MFNLKQQQNPAMDERIQKESNKLCAKLFYMLTIFVISGMVAQIANGMPFRVFCLQIICLVTSIGFVLAQLIRKGIFLIKDKDEALTTIHEGVLSNGYHIEVSILLFGELFFIYLEKEHSSWMSLYFLEWIIPALIYTVAAVKNSWLQWGGKKRQVEGKKVMKKLNIPAAILFGILIIPLELPTWLKDGVISVNEVMTIPIIMVGFGVIFYFVMGNMIDTGEKRANRSLQDIEEKEKMTLEE